jgi:hypothetical protein
MSAASSDSPPLPPAAARWSGRVTYGFTGGDDDPGRIPNGLIAAANSLLREMGHGAAAPTDVCRREFGVPGG